MSTKPEYASEVPYVPVNWQNRDDITGQLLQIIEAVLPEGKQLEATKHLVKETTKKYWIDLFNDQFDALSGRVSRPEDDGVLFWEDYCTALWEKTLSLRAIQNPN